jgi:hypothetical protein
MRTASSCGFVGILNGLILVSMALAQSPSPDPLDPRVREQRDLDFVSMRVETLEKKYGGAPAGKIKEAATDAIEKRKAEVGVLQRLIKAMDAHDGHALPVLRKERAQAGLASNRATERLAAREKAQQNTIRPEQAQALGLKLPGAARPKLDAMLAAHKNSAAAWEGVADLARLETPSAVFEDAKLKAQGTDDAVTLASRDLELTSEAEKLAQVVEKSKSEELRKCLAELRVANKAALAAAAKRVAVEVEIRLAGVKLREVRAKINETMPQVRAALAKKNAASPAPARPGKPSRAPKGGRSPAPSVAPSPAPSPASSR